jgi:hypothetical protein
MLLQQTPHLQVPYCCAVVRQHFALVINEPHVTQHVRPALARLQDTDHSRQPVDSIIRQCSSSCKDETPS